MLWCDIPDRCLQGLLRATREDLGTSTYLSINYCQDNFINEQIVDRDSHNGLARVWAGRPSKVYDGNNHAWMRGAWYECYCLVREELWRDTNTTCKETSHAQVYVVHI